MTDCSRHPNKALLYSDVLFTEALLIFFINFTASYHNTDAAAKLSAKKNCPADKGISLRNPLSGVYKIISNPKNVKMFAAHMTLSFAKRLMEVRMLSVSELFTCTKNKLASMITASPIERAVGAPPGVRSI